MHNLIGHPAMYNACLMKLTADKKNIKTMRMLVTPDGLVMVPVE